MTARNPGAPGSRLQDFTRTDFILAVFFRVTHDGLSERGPSRSLPKRRLRLFLPL